MVSKSTTFNLQKPVFENCSCVAEHFYLDSITDPTVTNTRELLEFTGNSTAANGMCSTNCHLLGPFLFLCGLLIFLLFVLKIPNVLVTIR